MTDKLKKYIETRDRRLLSKGHWVNNLLTENFNKLIEYEQINIGGRSSCGGKVDLTWVEFTAWNEIVKKANSLGYVIKTESIPQPNKSPTMAGGFWHENKYTLIKVPCEK